MSGVASRLGLEKFPASLTDRDLEFAFSGVFTYSVACILLICSDLNRFYKLRDSIQTLASFINNIDNFLQMMNANKILKRVSEFDKLREAGLTEDEIKELKGMEYDQEMRAAERADQIK